MTINIPDQVLAEAMTFTGAKTKREAVVTAVEKFNHLKRLARLNARVRGKFPNFMSRAELEKMRAMKSDVYSI